MADNKLKSAYDLAMERLNLGSGQGIALTDEQKKAIAEVGQKTKAKIAELEIMLHARIIESQGDEEKVEKLKNQHQLEITKVREKAEDEKERIRQAGGTGP